MPTFVPPLTQPAVPWPAPVHHQGVDYPSHHWTEDDVTIETAPLSYGSGNYGGAGRGKSALKHFKKEGINILLNWKS